ncbi:uncharacterized protein LOC133891445 isoform X2 [Phragmites australis]|nr:uncharacterized protein LOC133891445 isoform X2 [Phragmites australis]
MATFGSRRRRSRNLLIQYGVLGAYTLSSSLVPHALGSMQSSAVKSSMYPIWATSLYLLIGCADSITAYSLDDNNHFTRQQFLYLLYNTYLGLITRSDITLISYLLLVAPHKFLQRIWAYNLASTSWNLNKMVADYMYQEHTKSGSSYDPTSMKGYHYLVDWPLRESKLEAGMLYATESRADGAQVIDIERIWLCCGLSPELKDVCLSFSLFHLLRRRFFGFACAESSQRKTHDFVFKGLLSKNEDGGVDYNRVFKVIEVELAFMYDFFFTKYAVVYYGSKKVSTIWSLASATLISVTVYQLTTRIASNPNGSDFLHTTTSDVVITVLILACIALLQFLQVLLFWNTIWGRVSFVCHYVREKAVNKRGSICMRPFQKSCCMRFREIILTKIIGVSTSRSSKCYYQNKLGQYSLLESVRYKQHSPPKVGHSRFMQRFCSLLMHPDFDHLCEWNKDIIHAKSVRKGRGKPAAVNLPAEVKKALVNSLQRTQGVLASGESSLVYNEVRDLLWACRHDMLPVSDKENQTHVILTWHIATCYCEMAALKNLSPSTLGGELKFHLDVATILSKYCAYLVVDQPKLLPGHHYDTSLVFDSVAVEAARFLRKEKDKYEAMRSLPESTETSIFRKGVKLGRQLEEMEDDKRWKVLADFWVEMLLYVAPSDNVKEHIECLANGGEFLTHLWALLSHAGILDRGQRNVADIENVGADQPNPGELSYGAALRLRRASSYLDRCREGAAPATCSTNQPATSANCVQPPEISVEGGRTVTSGQSGGNDQFQGVAT